MNELQQKFAFIKESYAEEIAAQKVVTELDELPIAYELISDEWLTKALCADVAGAEVIAHTLDEADEGVTNRRRIYLEYNEAGNQAGLPKSVFCKASMTPESRFVIGINGGAEGEVEFFNTMRPTLGIEAPEAHFALADSDTCNSIILLKDLVGEDIEFGDHSTVITRGLAEDQMRLLAVFHGRFYESEELDTTYKSYRSMEEFFNTTDAMINWIAGCKRGFLLAKDVIPAELFGKVDEITALTSRSFTMHSELPRTLVHNDPHLKNWYIRDQSRMGLGDWQTVVKAHWSRDLTYTISTCLSVEDRRAWEQDLIRLYLKELGKAGVPVLSLEETMVLYRQQLLNSLAMWTFTLSPSEDAPVMQPPESCLVFIERMSNAINDLDALAAF